MRSSVWVAVLLAFLTSTTAVAGSLRVSVPPLFGSVPVILASDTAWGLFAEEGLAVTVVPLPSQRDRTMAFTAQQVDVLVADLTQAVIIVSQQSTDAVIAGATYSVEPADEGNSPPVMLISQRYARVTSVEELAQEASEGSVKIGVPRQSDLEFMLDQLFESTELPLPPAQQAYVGRDDLLINADFLGRGHFHAGVFPQPYADYLLSIDFPGKPEFFVLSDFMGIPVPPTVIVLQRSLLEERPEDVAAFFRALDGAVERVNTLPRDDLLELGWQLVTHLFMPGQEPHTLAAEDRENVEKAIEKLFVPEFPLPHSLDPELFNQVLSWAQRKGYVRFPARFDERVISPVR